MLRLTICHLFFFFNDTATTEIYTLSLHDALPIYLLRELLVEPVQGEEGRAEPVARQRTRVVAARARTARQLGRSEEHTSELQSQSNLVCRLLLEKKKGIQDQRINSLSFVIDKYRL